MQKIKKWNTNNLGNVQGANPILKLIFLLTNAVFFIPIYYFSFNILPIILITTMGAISTIFHSHQVWRDCYHRECTLCLMWMDTLIVFPAGTALYFLYYNTIPFWWYVCWIPAFFCWRYGLSKYGKNTYMFLHGSWHVIAGLLFVYAIGNSEM